MLGKFFDFSHTKKQRADAEITKKRSILIELKEHIELLEEQYDIDIGLQQDKLSLSLDRFKEQIARESARADQREFTGPIQKALAEIDTSTTSTTHQKVYQKVEFAEEKIKIKTSMQERLQEVNAKRDIQKQITELERQVRDCRANIGLLDRQIKRQETTEANYSGIYKFFLSGLRYLGLAENPIANYKARKKEYANSSLSNTREITKLNNTLPNATDNADPHTLNWRVQYLESIIAICHLEKEIYLLNLDEIRRDYNTYASEIRAIDGEDSDQEQTYGNDTRYKFSNKL